MNASSAADNYEGMTSQTNIIVDAILMSLSMNCHRALMNYVEIKRMTECNTVSNDGKIRYCDQLFLQHTEDNLIADWNKFFDYINTKRPLDVYYNLKLHTPKRIPELDQLGS